jgi:DNA-binding NarL/FixJ family response regulator
VLDREPDIDVVGEARDGLTAIEQTNRHEPDVVGASGFLLKYAAADDLVRAIRPA